MNTLTLLRLALLLLYFLVPTNLNIPSIKHAPSKKFHPTTNKRGAPRVAMGSICNHGVYIYFHASACDLVNDNDLLPTNVDVPSSYLYL